MPSPLTKKLKAKLKNRNHPLNQGPHGMLNTLNKAQLQTKLTLTPKTCRVPTLLRPSKMPTRR